MMNHDGRKGGAPLNVAPGEGAGKQASFAGQDVRVWLRATIVDVDRDLDGRLLSLLVGTTRVSVLVEQEDDHCASWEAGMIIDIHIGRYEAWIKPWGRDCSPVLCGLLYLDHQSLASAR